MRLTDAGLIFVCVFLCFAQIHHMRWIELENISRMQCEYNQKVDNACEAAMGYAVEQMDGKHLQINPEEIRAHFFEVLAINFGVFGDVAKQRKLKEYVPVMALMDVEGAVFYYTIHKKTKDGGVRSPKMDYVPYQTKAQGYEIFYTMGEDIRVYSDGELVFEGKYRDCPLSISILRKEVFVIERQKKIAQIMKERMEYYSNTCIHAGMESRKAISFYFPVIEKEDWYRAVKDVGILVLFEGYPYGRGMTGTYQRLAVGGARIVKK